MRTGELVGPLIEYLKDKTVYFLDALDRRLISLVKC